MNGRSFAEGDETMKMRKPTSILILFLVMASLVCGPTATAFELTGTQTRLIKQVNDTVIAAMERTSTTGDFRANISLGGIGAKTLLSHEEDRLVRQAASVFGLRMSGVDFMRTDSGPILLEVNKEPGFKGITATTKINVAQKVMEDFVHFCSDESSNNSERNMHIAMSTI